MSVTAPAVFPAVTYFFLRTGIRARRPAFIPAPAGSGLSGTHWPAAASTREQLRISEVRVFIGQPSGFKIRTRATSTKPGTERSRLLPGSESIVPESWGRSGFAPSSPHTGDWDLLHQLFELLAALAPDGEAVQ